MKKVLIDGKYAFLIKVGKVDVRYCHKIRVIWENTLNGKQYICVLEKYYKYPEELHIAEAKRLKGK